jgi:peptidoglycan hydrolase-like protein with peptidoglycan-binding domain
MPFSLIWLPQVLKNAGLRVAAVDGWQDRGHGDVGNIVGVICHHTAGPKNGNMPSLNTIVNGRTDLPGPLSQLGLGRDGAWFVIAAGKAFHAGAGSWKGVTTGNSSFIGIEAENTGLSNDSPWPDVQIDSYHRGVAAILNHIGRSVDFCAGHKEFALPPGRKTDPNFDMNSFRAAVAAIMSGAPAPALIPAFEPAKPDGAPGRPTLRRPATGEFVRLLQAKIGVVADGNFGPRTEAAVRAFQRERGVVPDGIVGPNTWAFLDQVPIPVPVV